MTLFSILIISLFIKSNSVSLEPYDFYKAMNDSENHILLDVRICEDFLFERIPGASWAGSQHELNKIVNHINRDTEIFIYCSYGDRTKQVTKILKRLKFKRTFELKGGLQQWHENHFPIDSMQIKINCFEEEP
jgi:rhodanese-related sulfurtransferase